jgi:hypothetical protein
LEGNTKASQLLQQNADSASLHGHIQQLIHEGNINQAAALAVLGSI